MNKLFIALLLSIALGSCSSGEETFKEDNNPFKRLKEVSDSTGGSIFEDKKPKEEEVIPLKTTPKEEESEEVQALKAKIKELESQIKSNNTFELDLVRSTYKPKNVYMVQLVLDVEYKKALARLKASNFPITKSISSYIKGSFTIEYCDNDVLKYIDKEADKDLKAFAKKFNCDIRYFNVDTTRHQKIMRTKK